MDFDSPRKLWLHYGRNEALNGNPLFFFKDRAYLVLYRDGILRLHRNEVKHGFQEEDVEMHPMRPMPGAIGVLCYGEASIGSKRSQSTSNKVQFFPAGTCEYRVVESSPLSKKTINGQAFADLGEVIRLESRKDPSKTLALRATLD